MCCLIVLPVLWTLSVLEKQTGSGIEAVLRRFDSSGEGVLDASEFALACEDLGFGGVSQDLFMELDPGNSGYIASNAIVDAIRGRGGSTREAKRFLYGLAASVGCQRVQVDTANWVLTPESVTSVRSELQRLLRIHDPPANVAECVSACAVAPRTRTHLNPLRPAMSWLPCRSC